jgi:hypothetical protein
MHSSFMHIDSDKSNIGDNDDESKDPIEKNIDIFHFIFGDEIIEERGEEPSRNKA